jgi:CheY-like chemotaxis protein
MFTKDILYMYSKTILIVDDGPLFLKMAKDFFRREQVDIVTATSGPEAADVFKKENPDLVFMDLYMTGGDGDEACKEIKSNYRLKSVPIVMMTSSDRPHDIERCRKAGCDDFIRKPFTREILLNTTRKFIKLPGWSGKRVKIKAPVKFGGNVEKLLTGALTDLSVGGFFLETDQLMPIGSELHIKLQLSRDFSPVQCKGKVVWLNRKINLKKDDASPGMGVEFIDIKKLDLLTIQGWMVSNS